MRLLLLLMLPLRPACQSACLWTTLWCGVNDLRRFTSVHVIEVGGGGLPGLAPIGCGLFGGGAWLCVYFCVLSITAITRA